MISAKPLSDEQVAMFLSSVDSSLALEPVSLEDIENTYLSDCLVEDEMLLSAITTKNNRLKATMSALVRSIDKALGGKIKSGEEFYSLISEKLKGRVISSAIVSNPRKAGQYAVITALIPFSDGQSVSIIFYAPDDDPLKINDTDTLIAFRFLLNKRDITHIVSPIEGKDLSLTQTCSNIANLVLKNTDKFTANKEKAAAEAKEIESIQEQTEAALIEANKLAEVADKNKVKLESTTANVAKLTAKLARVKETNAGLDADIASLKAKGEPQADGPEVKGNSSNDANDPKERTSALRLLKTPLTKSNELNVRLSDLMQKEDDDSYNIYDDWGGVTNQARLNRHKYPSKSCRRPNRGRK